MTKEEARALGWEGGSVEAYQAGAAIGGDRFGNREGFCRRKQEEPIPNAISTRSARIPAGLSA